MNFGFYGACSDSIFFEKLTISPGTGSSTTDAYYASSSYGRWSNEIYTASNGYALSTGGYQQWISDSLPPFPPVSVGSYTGRRLNELTQNQLHEQRLKMLKHDAWFQSLGLVTTGASNETMLTALETWEAQGHRVWDKYQHATVDIAGRAIAYPPSMPTMPTPGRIINRRRNQVIYIESPPPPPPSPPPPDYPPNFVPVVVGRPHYDVTHASYSDVEQALVDVFDMHIANLAHNASVTQMDDNTYRVILDHTSGSAANATAKGITDQFMDHLRSKTGLELSLTDEPIKRGWRTLCNGTNAPPPPPMATFQLVDNCVPSSNLITSAQECAEAAAFLSHSHLEIGTGSGCQMLGSMLVWGGATTETGYADCGVASCLQDNGEGAGCENVMCACRVAGPFDPSYVVAG